jgi:putative transposase
MCWLGQVSRTGYYREWRRSAPASEELSLREKIHEIVFAHRFYGYRRVTAALRQAGWAVNQKRVARLLRQDGLQALRPKRWVKTTQSGHRCAVFPNRLRQAEATGPDQIWLADITYLRTPSGFVYLAVVLDAWSRRVVGWALAETMTTQLVSSALQQAVAERQPAPALLHHSDRGVQYASQEYVRLLSQHSMIGSMSRLANPYDNARCESFFKTLKKEQAQPGPLNEWLSRLSSYLDYYNRTRLHSALHYLSPMLYEQHPGQALGDPVKGGEEFFQA